MSSAYKSVVLFVFEEKKNPKTSWFSFMPTGFQILLNIANLEVKPPKSGLYIVCSLMITTFVYIKSLKQVKGIALWEAYMQ